jgi:hypothetical protein
MGIICLMTDHLLHIEFSCNYTTVSSCRTWQYVSARLLFLTNFLACSFFYSLSLGISVMRPRNQFNAQFHVIDIFRPIF